MMISNDTANKITIKLKDLQYTKQQQQEQLKIHNINYLAYI